MRCHARTAVAVLLVGVLTGFGGPTVGWGQEAPGVTVDVTMKFRPKQEDVDYDIPDPKDYKQCKVSVIREGKASGWAVTGPAGQLLRRFMDTNADNVVDQWCYYKNGIEVYRDVDSNYNDKVDQFRWLNTGGTRWAIDTNEDGRIDNYRIISPEELSRVAVRALVTQDATLLTPLLVTKEDLKTLGVKGKLETEVLKSVEDAAAKLKKALAGSKTIGPQTRWMRFDGSHPSLILADQQDVTNDLFVYENVMAIVETGSGANSKSGLVQLGELVRINSTWKLTTIPVPAGEGSGTVLEFGALMQSAFPASGSTAATGGLSPEVEQLLKQLQDLDKKPPAPNATRTQLASYHGARVDLIEKVVRVMTAPDDLRLWVKQLADSVTAAVQVGTLENGVDRLHALEKSITRSTASDLLPYVVYRRMLAEYSVSMQKANNDDRQKVQEKWEKDLEAYVNTYPKSDDSADAILQLAIAREFALKYDDAVKWYRRIVKDHAQNPSAARANGAIARLEHQGKVLNLSGAGLNGRPIDMTQYKGKIVLVIFWATWCKPCTEELPQIEKLYADYKARGFEVLGVNLDNTKDAVPAYVAQHKVPWPHIHEPGGLDSPPAKQFGIVTVPTMFLVNVDGKVHNSRASLADVKTSLADAFKAPK